MQVYAVSEKQYRHLYKLSESWVIQTFSDVYFNERVFRTIC
jgi:hypothetical protein